MSPLISPDGLMDSLTGGWGVTRAGSCLTTDLNSWSLLYLLMAAGALVTGVQSSCSAPSPELGRLVVTGEAVVGSNVDRA